MVVMLLLSALNKPISCGEVRWSCVASWWDTLVVEGRCDSHPLADKAVGDPRVPAVATCTSLRTVAAMLAIASGAPGSAVLSRG